jgi:hypothetical protein
MHGLQKSLSINKLSQRVLGKTALSRCDLFKSYTGAKTLDAHSLLTILILR